MCVILSYYYFKIDDIFDLGILYNNLFGVLRIGVIDYWLLNGNGKFIDVK